MLLGKRYLKITEMFSRFFIQYNTQNQWMERKKTKLKVGEKHAESCSYRAIQSSSSCTAALQIPQECYENVLCV